jgi:hypothetical protein
MNALCIAVILLCRESMFSAPSQLRQLHGEHTHRGLSAKT